MLSKDNWFKNHKHSYFMLCSKFLWPSELLGHVTQDFLWRLHLSHLSLNKESEPSLLMVPTPNMNFLTVHGAAQSRCLSDITKILNATAVPTNHQRAPRHWEMNPRTTKSQGLQGWQGPPRSPSPFTNPTPPQPCPSCHIQVSISYPEMCAGCSAQPFLAVRAGST